MPANKPILLSDVDQALDHTIVEADQQRAAALSRVQTLLLIKEKQNLREQARLSDKYSPDHPRVVALAEQIETKRGLTREVALETVRANTPAPKVDEHTWVVHGFVRDQLDKGLANLTIALYDSRERDAHWVKELGYTCTDDKGYFKLETRNFKTPTAPVFLRVLNNQGATLHIELDPLTPVAGQLDFREIVLQGNKLDCPAPPPPPDTREWIVRGRVTDSSGAVLPRVTVSLSDKEQVFATRLGTTQTDVTGNFSFSFQAEAFRDLIEQKPDLFLQVTGDKLKQPFTHPTALHFEPGRAENVTIIVTAEELKPWTVRGLVTDTAGKALAGYNVSFVDAGQKPVDQLGQTQTDTNGKFERVFPSENFRTLIEQKVKLFAQISGPALKTPQIHPQELLLTPGGVEELKVTITLDAQEPKTWIVRGQVKSTAGKVLDKHIVAISDREKKFTELLGSTLTNPNGVFEFIYQAENFTELIRQNPDLILQVLNPSRRLIYTHDQLLHFELGKVLSIPIFVKSD